MRVEAIQWISKMAQEAEVTFSDGHFTCKAFSQPCEVSVDEEVPLPLHIFGIREVMIANDSDVFVMKLNEVGLDQRVVATVIDLSSKLLAVGGITFIVDDYLPGGLVVGDRVKFECARIDLW
jgi:hypothetical protein